MGATLTSERIPVPGGDTATDDPFHDPLLLGIGIVFIVVALVILAMTGLFYWGSVYHAPSWGANSFPPPVVH